MHKLTVHKRRQHHQFLQTLVIPHLNKDTIQVLKTVKFQVKLRLNK